MTRKISEVSAILGLLFVLQGCVRAAPVPAVSGRSYSARVGDQNVLVDSEFRGEEVAWVAVRNWPASSGAVRGHEDTRITYPPGGPLIRRQNGEMHPPDGETRIYFFEGTDLITFPIQIRGADIANLDLSTVKAYADILTYFRRFEVRPGGRAYGV